MSNKSNETTPNPAPEHEVEIVLKAFDARVIGPGAHLYASHVAEGFMKLDRYKQEVLSLNRCAARLQDELSDSKTVMIKIQRDIEIRGRNGDGCVVCGGTGRPEAQPSAKEAHEAFYLGWNVCREAVAKLMPPPYGVVLDEERRRERAQSEDHDPGCDSLELSPSLGPSMKPCNCRGRKSEPCDESGVGFAVTSGGASRKTGVATDVGSGSPPGAASEADNAGASAVPGEICPVCNGKRTVLHNGDDCKCPACLGTGLEVPGWRVPLSESAEALLRSLVTEDRCIGLETNAHIRELSAAGLIRNCHARYNRELPDGEQGLFAWWPTAKGKAWATR